MGAMRRSLTVLLAAVARLASRHDVLNYVRSTLRQGDHVINRQPVAEFAAVRTAVVIGIFQRSPLLARESTRRTQFQCPSALIAFENLLLVGFRPLAHPFLDALSVQLSVLGLSWCRTAVVTILATAIEPVSRAVCSIEVICWPDLLAWTATAFFRWYHDARRSVRTLTGRAPRRQAARLAGISPEVSCRLGQLAIAAPLLRNLDGRRSIRGAAVLAGHMRGTRLQVVPTQRDHAATPGAWLRDPVDGGRFASRSHACLADRSRRPFRVARVTVEVGVDLEQSTRAALIHLAQYTASAELAASMRD
jgi:hypothetical protein